MKKITLLAGFLLLVSPLAAFCQDSGEDVVKQFNKELAKWKRNVASPSYGLMLFHGSVRPVESASFTSDIDKKGFLIQGIDTRFFVGKNVMTKGGFYSGMETGVFAYVSGLIPGARGFTDTVVIDDGGYVWTGTYDARVKVDGAFVFIMGKYGYRIDAGLPLFGLGLGAEIGVGVGIHSGGVTLFIGDRKDPMAEHDLESGGSSLGLLVDAALEASLRLGRDFRFFGKLGLIVLPLKYSVWDPMRIDRGIIDGSPNGDEEYMRYALQNYVVEMDAFAYELRAGFALSFN